MKGKNSITRFLCVRLPVLLLVAALLSSCSMLRLAYKNAETLSWWWIDSYVDFDREQRELVKEKLEKFFTWHRKTQLREYAKLLAEAQQAVQDPPDAEAVLDFSQAIRKRLAAMAEHAAPDIAQIALTLTPGQLANIEKKFAAGNKAYDKDHLRGDAEQRHRQRMKKLTEQAEYWFGDLTREQEAKLRKLEEAAPMDNELYQQARERRQQDILDVLAKIQAEQPSKVAATKMVKEVLLVHLVHTGGPEFADFIDSYNEGMASVTAGILRMVTKEQRAHAHAKLQGFIDDCRELGATP